MLKQKQLIILDNRKIKSYCMLDNIKVNKFMNNLVKYFVTILGIGFFPFAPGTFGSIFAIFVWYLSITLLSIFIFFIIILFTLFFISFKSVQIYLRNEKR